MLAETEQDSKDGMQGAEQQAAKTRWRDERLAALAAFKKTQKAAKK